MYDVLLQGFYQAALGVYEQIMDNEEFVDLVTNKVSIIYTRCIDWMILNTVFL